MDKTITSHLKFTTLQPTDLIDNNLLRTKHNAVL